MVHVIKVEQTNVWAHCKNCDRRWLVRSRLHLGIVVRKLLRAAALGQFDEVPMVAIS